MRERFFHIFVFNEAGYFCDGNNVSSILKNGEDNNGEEKDDCNRANSLGGKLS